MRVGTLIVRTAQNGILLISVYQFFYGQFLKVTWSYTDTDILMNIHVYKEFPYMDNRYWCVQWIIKHGYPCKIWIFISCMYISPYL